ncbi:hypothetical protein LTS17_012387 [Exophiala oligosperma]
MSTTIPKKTKTLLNNTDRNVNIRVKLEEFGFEVANSLMRLNEILKVQVLFAANKGRRGSKCDFLNHPETPPVRKS